MPRHAHSTSSAFEKAVHAIDENTAARANAARQAELRQAAEKRERVAAQRREERNWVARKKQVEQKIGPLLKCLENLPVRQTIYPSNLSDQRYNMRFVAITEQLENKDLAIKLGYSTEAGHLHGRNIPCYGWVDARSLSMEFHFTQNHGRPVLKSVKIDHNGFFPLIEGQRQKILPVQSDGRLPSDVYNAIGTWLAHTVPERKEEFAHLAKMKPA
jgi:hypothetical protein